ncbi:hypothetical protein [Pseudosulfitobacter pseudonitzschiae]|uniref:hypothetical protein n=1 Tax=Pseudosulfitobacter pseudonitzschiae TaxID=1402135 RepID=UPI003B80A7C7
MPKMKQKSIVTLLLDRSGSMQSVKAQTVEAINAWISELRKAKDDMRFTLVQFDAYHGGNQASGSSAVPSGFPAGLVLGGMSGKGVLSMHGSETMCLEKTIDMKPVSDVPDLTESDFMPRGSTPLIDAAVSTIRAIEETVSGRDDIKVILAIQTDGFENSSIENDWTTLQSLVKEKEAIGWEILFMGAGIDAYSQAGMMGVSRDKTLSYGKDRAATRSAFSSTASKSVLYASGAAQSMAYTDAEKLAAGDSYK